ncbi:MAG TPA: alpha/beta fold hydrolase [Dokdonella sp.]
MALVLSKNSTVVLNSIRLAVFRLGIRIGGTFAPGAILERAARWFCTPSAQARERAGSMESDARRGVMCVGGERLAIYEWGEPRAQPYVLLSHGWSSFALRFQPWIAPLRAAGFAIVAFDQVGHGQSSGGRTTLPQFAHHLGCVAEHYGPAAAVIGHSMGGAAAAIAMTDGLRAERAVLLAPAADLAAALRRFTRGIGLPRCLSKRLRERVEAQAQVRFDSLLMHPRVRRLAQPALIVHDLDDREVPWEEGERYARYWPGARLLSTGGLGHHRVAADAGVIDAALQFLRGGEVGARVVSTQELPYGYA